MRRIRHRLEYLGVRVLAALAGSLSDAGRKRAGIFLGRLMRLLVPSLDRTARDNIARAYPEWDGGRVTALARTNFGHVGRVALEFFSSRAMTPEAILGKIRFEGQEVFDAALAEGKGVFLFGGHLGNWEWGGLALHLRGYRLHSIWRRMSNPLVEDLVCGIRTRFGGELIGHRNAVRPVLKALKEGGVVAFLMDQRARGGDFVPSRFFGRPVATNQGLALLALRTGTPVVFAECVRDGEGYVMRFGPRVEPPPAATRDEAVRLYTRRFDELLEAAVRRHPEQWFWFHKRWKLPKEFPEESPT